MSDPQDTGGAGAAGPTGGQQPAGPPPVPPPGAEPTAEEPTAWSWGPLGPGAPGYGPSPAAGAQPPTPQHGRPQYGSPPYGSPQYGQPQYGQPQYGQPQYGPPQYGQPQYGQPQYGQPQYGQPPYGSPQYGQPQYGQPGWGPLPAAAPVPVQRGIVPLRPLGLGEIYDGAFRAIRANPRVMFGFSAVVVTAIVLVESLVQWYSFGWFGDWASTPVGTDLEFSAGDMIGTGLGSFVLLVLSFVASTILTGLLTVSVSRSVIGTTISVAEAWQAVRPQVWRLLVLTLVVVGLALVPAVLLVVAIIVLAAADQPGLSVAVGLLGLLGYLAYVVWVITRTTLGPPALVLEKQRVVAGLKRGWQLTAGSFWRVFGIVLLTNVIVGFVAGVVTFPASLVITLVSPTDPFSPLALSVNGVAAIIASVVTTPFTAAVVALLYIDLRMRREGLDVSLGRAAEEAAATGRTG